jgi:hypothetical protein
MSWVPDCPNWNSSANDFMANLRELYPRAGALNKPRDASNLMMFDLPEEVGPKTEKTQESIEDWAIGLEINEQLVSAPRGKKGIDFGFIPIEWLCWAAAAGKAHESICVLQSQTLTHIPLFLHSSICAMMLRLIYLLLRHQVISDGRFLGPDCPNSQNNRSSHVWRVAAGFMPIWALIDAGSHHNAKTVRTCAERNQPKP